MRLAVLLFVAALSAAAPALAQDQGEITFWTSVRESKNPAEIQAYLDAYPQGKFAPLARLRLKELGGSADAPSSTPAPSAPTAASPAPGPSPAAATEWRTFRSEDGNFTVLLPAEPTLKTVTSPDRTSYRYTVDLGDSAYVVSYSDYKGDRFAGENPAIVLDRGQEGVLEGFKGKLRKNRSKTVAGYPGREVVFDTPDKNAGKIRMFLVDNRLYQIVFFGPAGAETKPEIRTFLDSFKLIKDPGTHAAPAVVAPAGSDWHRFTSAEGRFSVLFPGDPDVAAGSADERGHSQHRFVVDKGDSAYLVTYDDYRPGTITDANSKKVLDRSQDAVLESMKGTLRQHRLVTVAGHPGREVVFDTPNKTSGIVRIYTVGNRLYQVWYLGPTGQEGQPEVERYLDSFALAE